MLEETLIEWGEKIRKEAHKEARLEGRKEGQILGLRRVLLQQMSLRFGRLPKDVRSRVEQITSTQELEKLTRKILSAKSLEEMGLS